MASYYDVLLNAGILTLDTRPPHRCAGRQVQPGQLIHYSVLEYLKPGNETTTQAQVPATNRQVRHWAKCLPFGRSAAAAKTTYTPSAQLNLGVVVTWDSIRDRPEEHSKLLVEDLYSSAPAVLECIMKVFNSSEPNWQALGKREIDPFVALALSGGYYRVCGGLLSCELTYLVAERIELIINIPGAADYLFRMLQAMHDAMTLRDMANKKSLLGINHEMQMGFVRAVIAIIAAYQSPPSTAQRYPNTHLRAWLDSASREQCEHILGVFGNSASPGLREL